MKRNVQTFIGCDAGYDESSIVIFGAPYDRTALHRGAFMLPNSVRRLIDA